MKRPARVMIPVVLAFCLSFALPPQASAAKYLIRAGTVLVEESPAAKCLQMFGDIVESQTMGEVEVQVFTGGKLGAEREMIEGCQLNNVQMAIPSVGVLANFSDEMRVLNLPFLLTDRRVAHKVLVKDPIGRKLLDVLSQKGLIGLTFGDYGMRNLTSKKEVRSLDDLKGMKIRTMKVPDHLALWEALGANPTPIAFTELYSALQQGVVDGQENPWETIFLSKFYEVQDYATVTGHIYDVQPLIMSKKFYDGLPAGYQDIVRMAADIATEYMWYITGKQNDMFKEKCIKKGIKINEFSEEQIEESRQLTQPVVDQIKEVAGDELVNEYISAVKETEEQLR